MKGSGYKPTVTLPTVTYKGDKPQREIMWDMLQNGEVSEPELSQAGIAGPKNIALEIEKMYKVKLKRRKERVRRSTFDPNSKVITHYSL